MPYVGKDLATCLTAFGLPCEFIELQQAPRITSYHFKILDISKVTKPKIKRAIERLSLYAGIDFYITNSNISNIAIYHPENNNNIVYLLNEYEAEPPKENSSTFLLGIDEENKRQFLNLDRAIHILIAGTTGSGKSIFLKNIIYSLAAYNNSNSLKYSIIDKKQSLNYLSAAENCIYLGNSDRDAISILKAYQKEMYNRYDDMRKKGIEKNSGQYPKWVLIVDELADLMLTSQKDIIEKILVSLCQLGRAAGIHCILCTQSPRVAVISGLIQANTPTKIIFKTASIKESILCLGHKGAEDLLGAGDALIKYPDSTKEKRLQTPFISENNLKIAFKA